jgi:hypothetical protein
MKPAKSNNKLPKQKTGNKCIVSYVNHIEYYSNNILLRNDCLLNQAGKVGGIKAVNSLIDLGEDAEVASIIMEYTNLYGANHIVDVLFGSIHNIDSAIKEETPSITYITSTESGYEHSGSRNQPRENSYFWDNSKVTLSSFTAKEAIEALPTIKYFVKEILHITYELPEFTDNNYFKLTAHFIACNVGMFSLTGKFNVANSLLPTAIYGNKLLAHEYLTNFKQSNFDKEENKSISTPYEFIQKCGFDMVTQATLGMASSLLSGNPFIYDIAISATVGGVECYNLYTQQDSKSSQASNKGITQATLPYLADTIVYYATTWNMDFDLSSTFGQMLAVKKGFTVLSNVVMTDYLSKLIIKNFWDSEIVQNEKEEKEEKEDLGGVIDYSHEEF